LEQSERTRYQERAANFLEADRSDRFFSSQTIGMLSVADIERALQARKAVATLKSELSRDLDELREIFALISAKIQEMGDLLAELRQHWADDEDAARTLARLIYEEKLEVTLTRLAATLGDYNPMRASAQPMAADRDLATATGPASHILSGEVEGDADVSPVVTGESSVTASVEPEIDGTVLMAKPEMNGNILAGAFTANGDTLTAPPAAEAQNRALASAGDRSGADATDPFMGALTASWEETMQSWEEIIQSWGVARAEPAVEPTADGTRPGAVEYNGVDSAALHTEPSD